MLPSFEYLDQALCDAQALWRFEPFHASLAPELPWQRSHPDLCTWLATLTETQIEHYKTDFSALALQLQRFLPQLGALHSEILLPRYPHADAPIERSLATGIPGRKRDQIAAMSGVALSQHRGKGWLEWCSGKGYLGRVLTTQSGETVTSLEYQQALCDSGQQYADQHQLAMHFIQADAFQPDAIAAFHPEQHAVALHACGDLHVRLVELASQVTLPALTVAPCCYHLVQHPQYQAMSQLAKQSPLKLSRAELRIPLQQTVTGGERVRRHRQQEMVFRLGFDLIVREELGYCDYLPVPSLKKSQLADGFASLCEWAAQVKAVNLPDVDFAAYEQRAITRFWHMERLSLVQTMYQRALEIWLVLDKAIYLKEQGYKVELGEFCEVSATPRNILLHAYK